MSGDWFKVDASFATNKKLFEAGVEATWVYLYALGRNRVKRGNGFIALGDLHPPLLASLMRRTGAEVQRFIDALFEVGCLVPAEGNRICIKGWDDSWKARDLSTPRVQKLRALNKAGNGDETPETHERRGEEKRIKKQKVVFDPLALELSEELRGKVLEEQPDHRLGLPGYWTTSLRSVWAAEFDRMLRLDRRKPEQVRGAIAWLFGGQGGNDKRFVVQSPKALREKFDRVVAAMRPATQPSLYRDIA